MAQLATTFSSYDVVGDREDLSDLISNIAPTDTPFQSNIGEDSTGNTFFEWQTDTLASASNQAQIEGDDLGDTYTAVTATTRLGNYTQIQRKDFLISGTEQALNKAGRADERGYQAAKAAKELKRDWETALLDNNAAVAGNDTTARETGGLTAWVKSNTSAGTNGTDPVWTTVPTGARSDGTQRAFTEPILQDVVKQVWDAGGDPSILMVGSFNKQAVSAFSGIAAQRYMAPDASPSTIIGAADVYVSDFGNLSVVPNRFQRARDGHVFDPGMARVRRLRPFEIHDMAKTGDAEKFLITHEAGLQVDNEAAFGIAADLNTS